MSYLADGTLTWNWIPNSFAGVMCGLRGLPQPGICFIAFQGKMYCFHSVVRFRSPPKSLKHSVQTPPSGSVFTSGTLSRTLPVEVSPFLAQNEIPAYLEAS